MNAGYNETVKTIIRELNDMSALLKYQGTKDWQIDEDGYEVEFEKRETEDLGNINLDWLKQSSSFELISMFYMIKRLSRQWEMFYEKRFDNNWTNAIFDLCDHTIDNVVDTKKKAWESNNDTPKP